MACLGRLVNQGDPMASSPHFLQEVMVSTYERRRFQTDIINDMPLYPTEAILWDENQVPSVHYTGTASLPDPASSLCLLACSQAVGARDSSHGLNRLSDTTMFAFRTGLPASNRRPFQHVQLVSPLCELLPVCPFMKPMATDVPSAWGTKSPAAGCYPALLQSVI